MTSSGRKLPCCIPSCTSVYYRNSKNNTKHFFLFPTDHSRCQDWISCTKLKFQNFDCDIKHAKVCDAHFSNKQFTNSLHNRLSTFAIPDIVGEDDKLPLSTFVTSDIVTEDYSLPCTSSGKTSTRRRLDVDISESMNLSSSDMVDLADTVDLEACTLFHFLLCSTSYRILVE